MKIDLTFKKSNADALVDKYRVYRSTDKAQLYAGGNIIGEITSFAGSTNVTYSDTTAVLGVSYYYGLETVSKTGYSFMTAPKNICVAKNLGAVGAVPLAGDYDAGYVDISTVTGMSVYDTVTNLFKGAINSAQLSEAMTGTISYNNLASDRKGTVSGYYKGLPSLYYPGGSQYIMFNGMSTKAVNALMKAIGIAINNLAPISYDGDDYKIRLMTVGEWKKLFLNCYLDYAMTNANVEQPLVPILTSAIFTNNNMFAFADDATGVVSGYNTTPTDKGPNKVNDGLNITTSHSFWFPFALTPLQY